LNGHHIASTLGSGGSTTQLTGRRSFAIRLDSVLGAVGAAVRALTELFELAKFSVEPMGTAEKERAIAALEELRMEVYA
jgi:hypothetical protein